jgi:hypothetical protein
MLSERKLLIRLAEIVALAGSVSSISAAAAVALGYMSPARVESFLALLLILGSGVFVVAVLLFHEFAQVLHGKPPSILRETELSIGETKQLLRWCPGPTKLAFVIAGAIMLIAIFSVGTVEWSSGQPFTAKEAKGIPLTLAVFMLVALPILASASRMPGAFADHFSPMTRTQNDA